MNQANPVELYERANAYARTLVAGVRPDQWQGPSACDWNVRGLVNHIVEGNAMALEFARGRIQTIEALMAVERRDVLGDDPVAAFDRAFKALDGAMHEPGFMESTVIMPYMPAPLSGAQFAGQRMSEVLLHAWDLARATNQDDTLDPELCTVVYEQMKPLEPMLNQSGAFGTHVDVPGDANIQAKMLAVAGRKR